MAERTDTERLDWWQSQRIRTLAPVMESEGWRICEYEGGSLSPVGAFAPALRQAIDAAMDAERAALGDG